MTRSPVAIPRAIGRAIVAQARREAPRECCGLLLGRGRRVTFAVAMRNVASGTTRYRIDDRDHLQLRRILRTFVPALDIVGVYHSHPHGEAWASPSDVAQAMYPDWVYVIVGLKRKAPAIRAFRIRDDAAQERRVEWK